MSKKSTEANSATSTTRSAAPGGGNNPISSNHRRSHQQRRHRSKSGLQNINSKSNSDNNVLAFGVPGASSDAAPSILFYFNKDQPGLIDDPYHNLSTPCCAFIRAAALDIIPENGHDESAGVNKSSPPTSTHPSNLLGRLVRQHLLDQHKQQQDRQRTSTAATAVILTKDTDNSNNDDLQSSSNFASKRKRKKKKKKSSKTTATASASGDDEISIRGRDALEDEENYGTKLGRSTSVVIATNDTNGVAEEKGLETMDHASQPPTAIWTTITTAAATNTWASDNQSQGLPVNQEMDNSSAHGEEMANDVVDQCLDAIAVLMATPELSLPPNRTLEAFLEFISQQLSQIPLKKNHSINKNGEVNNNNNNNSNNMVGSKRKKSAPNFGHKNSGELDHSRFRPFSIPVDTLERVCGSIHCPWCRQSAQNFLYLALNQQRRRHLPAAMENDSPPPPNCSFFVITAAAAAIPVENGYKSRLAIPVSHALQQHNFNYDDDLDVERAFDYVALEEGTNVTNEEEKHYLGFEEGAISQEMLALQLEKQDDSDNEVVVLSNAAVAVGNQQTMEAFLRSIVLGCGLEARASSYHACENNDSAFPLDENQFQLICAREQEIEKSLLDQLSKISLQLHCAQTQWEDLARSFQSSNFEEEANSRGEEFKNLPRLRDCERECLDIAHGMLGFLRCVTKDHNSLVLKTDETRSLNRIIEGLWEGFFEMVKGMMDCTDEYHRQLEELTNRDVVPQVFVSAAHRRSYRHMLETKLNHLSNYYKRLEQIKEDENSSSYQGQDGPSLLRFIYTADSFFHTIEDEKIADRENMDQAKLDELWGEATKQLITCASAINTIYMSDIQKEEQSRRETLDALQLRFFQMIKSQYNQITEHHRLDGRDIQRWQELVGQYISLQKQRRDEGAATSTDAAAAIPAAANNQGLFQRITRVMFRLWSHTNSIYCHAHRSKELSQSSMPLELKKWMLDGRQVRNVAIRNLSSDEPCAGGGGKRRVICILAGLLYRWLSDRCEEWNSELAEAELLTSVENAALLNGNEQLISSKTVKSTKKTRNKKREKKSVGPESSVVMSEQPSLDIENPAVDAKSSGSEDDLVDQQTNGDVYYVETMGTMVIPFLDDQASRDQEEKSDGTRDLDANIMNQSEEHLSHGEEVNSCDTCSKNGEGSPELLKNHEYCQDFGSDRNSSIFVVDPLGNESAEEFLVGRLFELLNGQQHYVQL